MYLDWVRRPKKPCHVGREVEVLTRQPQDHPAVLVSYQSTKRVSLTDRIRLWGTAIPNPLALAQWFGRGAAR